MYELDEKDMVILDTLKKNSQLSIGKISRKTGIPVATVHNRIKKMKANGVISAYTIKVNPEKLGRKMVAYVLVKATQKTDQATMLKEISKHAFVEYCSMVTGEFDLIFRIRVKDMEELNSFVLKYLRLLDQVAETRTMISYENIENENVF